MGLKPTRADDSVSPYLEHSTICVGAPSKLIFVDIDI